jgi:hypothetical protein
MVEQPGEPRGFGLHPPTYITDLLGGQYRPEKNAWIRILLSFEGSLISHLAQVFVHMLESLRNSRLEDKHESN